VRDAVTPPVTAPTGAELDLDNPPERARPRYRWRGPLAVAVAAVLVGAAAGAAVRAATAGTPPPALPQAEISFVEAHLDGSAVVTVRLTVHNSAPAPVVVSDFVAGGVATTQVTEHVNRPVPGHGTTSILASMTADCSRTLVFTPLKAQLRLGDGAVVDAVPQRELASAGGLCRLVRSELPDGWWDPWPQVTVRPVGEYLEVTMPALDAGASLAGIFAGQTIFAYVRAPEPLGNGYKPIYLLPPKGCVLSDTRRMPTGLKFLLTGTGGLRTRYVPVGPELARWLLRRC
jgi:hypothetical protein